jgi:hypothetical protein
MRENKQSIIDRVYCFIWYYTEFWLPPAERRPFTFIMRDIYHQSPCIAVCILAALAYTLGRFVVVDWLYIVLFFAGLLLGHLFWGKKYKPGEQENPPFMGR